MFSFFQEMYDKIKDLTCFFCISFVFADLNQHLKPSLQIMNLLITITFFILSLAVVSIDAEFRDDSIFKRSDGQDVNYHLLEPNKNWNLC